MKTRLFLFARFGITYMPNPGVVPLRIRGGSPLDDAVYVATMIRSQEYNEALAWDIRAGFYYR